MDVKGKIKVAKVQCDDAALLSRVMPANWRTWNVPEMTSQSMNYGAAREITGDVDIALKYFRRGLHGVCVLWLLTTV